MDTTHIILIITSIVTLASAVCAATPTPDPNTFLGKLYKIIEFFGLVIGKAKDQGLLSSKKDV